MQQLNPDFASIINTLTEECVANLAAKLTRHDDALAGFGQELEMLKEAQKAVELEGLRAEEIAEIDRGDRGDGRALPRRRLHHRQAHGQRVVATGKNFQSQLTMFRKEQERKEAKMQENFDDNERNLAAEAQNVQDQLGNMT